jgi:uncharacterized protein (DUF488 family)
MAEPLLTTGHGTASQVELTDRLHGAGVDLLVDVRTAPGSRRLPHVKRDELARWLPEAGVAYRWDKRLGGFRKAPADSPDTAIRNESFRGYAAWTRSEEFAAAVDDLLRDVAGATVVVMCSESVWWRCHRRMIADYVQLVRGVAVRHLMPDGRITDHRPTEGVRVRNGLLVYDAGASPLRL